MATRNLISIKGYRMRLTALDACGDPVDSPYRTVVTDGFIRVSLTGEYDQGQTFLARSMWGELCVNDKDPDQLTRVNVSIELCAIDPDALLLLTNDRPVVVSGDAQGVTMRSERNWTAFALEVWTKAVGANCDGKWGYFVLPFVRNGRIDGDVTIQNGTLTVSIAAQAFPATSAWNTTPYGSNPLGVPFPAGDLWGVVVSSVQPPALVDFSGARLLEGGVFWIDAQASPTV